MRFIRENIFLLSTVAVVVLGGGIMLAFGSGIAGHVDEALSSRKELSTQLSQLRRPLLNTDVVEAERQRVEKVLAMQQMAVDESIAWNRRNYQPFVLPFEAEDGQREVPAFPVDRELYRHYNLTFNAPRVYRKELSKLLDTLRPVVPPTKDEIAEERILWERKLEDERRGREGKGRNGAKAPKGKGDPIAEGDDAKKEGPATERAHTMAKQALLVRHAQRAMIYASTEALDIVLAPPDPVATPIDKIWQAQLNYWVTKDIIGAIRATNEQSARQAQARKEKASVLNAAVKELREIVINENYVIGAKVTGSAKGSVRRGARGVPVARPARGGRTARGARAARAPVAETRRMVDNLTQRASCQQYDVLHYNFTVAMSLRFLNALEQNLMTRNYHTILSVRITQLSDVPADRYYGTDPVMIVTLQGELLLLTAWGRGTEHNCMISDRDFLVKGKDRWEDFVTKLSRQGKRDKPSPGKHIWSLLSTGLKQAIDRGRLGGAIKQRVIREINDLLAGKDKDKRLYDKASWQGVKLGLWESALLVKLNKKTIQDPDIPRLNRALLKAAFPDEIARSPYLPPLMPAEFKPSKQSER